jgi:hypothetical protein
MELISNMPCISKTIFRNFLLYQYTHLDIDLQVEIIYGWDNVRAGSKTKIYLLLQVSILVQIGVKYQPHETG